MEGRMGTRYDVIVIGGGHGGARVIIPRASAP